MNSRSAKNDEKAKIVRVAQGPRKKPRPSTATMPHQARTRAFRFCTVARPFSSLTVEAKMAPKTLAITNGDHSAHQAEEFVVRGQVAQTHGKTSKWKAGKQIG